MKYDPPRLVVIELFEPERRYALEDFAWLPDEPAEPGTVTPGTVTPRTPTRSLGVVNADKAVNVLAALWPDGRPGAPARWSA
jgi:hypothetical protein